MHECQKRKQSCPVHAAKSYASTTVYSSIISHNYTKAEVKTIQYRTSQLMLERDKWPFLDDQEADILDRAEQAGQYFADKVKAYLIMTFGTQADASSDR